ncbi:MAG: restriction endonuclease subunit S [Reichenbachiella sp.]
MIENDGYNEEIRLVPKLRFKEFEGELELLDLDQIAEFKSGRTPSKDNPAYWKGDIPWISAGSMVGKYYSKSDRKLTVLGLTKGSPLAVKDTLLLLVRGGMLYSKIPIGIAEQDVAFNQDVKALIVNEKSSSDFVYQWFLANEHRLLNMVVGTGVGAGKLETDDLKQLKINLPTLHEQQKIVGFLTVIDEKIQHLNRKKSLLEQYKKGVMQNLFKPPLLGAVRRFEGKRERAIRFKDEDGTDYPDWEEKKLGELASRVAVRNKFNRLNHVLTNSATRGIVSQQDYFDKDIANQENLAGYYVVSKNDFVYNPRISKHAPVGPIKRNKIGEGVVSPLYLVFRFNEENLEYFEYYFSTNGWHQYLNTVANSEARRDRMNISQGDFFNMLIPYPCEMERKKLVDCLSSIDQKIEAVNQQIKHWQTFKKGLLQRMFVAV